MYVSIYLSLFASIYLSIYLCSYVSGRFKVILLFRTGKCVNGIPGNEAWSTIPLLGQMDPKFVKLSKRKTNELIAFVKPLFTTKLYSTETLLLEI